MNELYSNNRNIIFDNMCDLFERLLSNDIIQKSIQVILVLTKWDLVLEKGIEKSLPSKPPKIIQKFEKIISWIIELFVVKFYILKPCFH